MNASDPAEFTAEAAGHGHAMDRMYRFQRHIYDATRKYYLLGRDQLVADLGVPPGGSVLEVGCGTGRNLLQVAQRYPQAKLYGVDISAEMLKSAQASLVRSIDRRRIMLACADATAMDAVRIFGVSDFDRVYVSYSLSMIPDWQAALAQAFALVRPGGELHVVDFGQCEGLPGIFRSALFAWLGQFGVTARSGLLNACQTLASQCGAMVSFSPMYNGYCWHLKMRKAESQIFLPIAN